MLSDKIFVTGIFFVFLINLAILIHGMDLFHRQEKRFDFFLQLLDFFLKALSFICTFFNVIIKLSKALKALFTHGKDSVGSDL